ncbi:coenzyme F420-0:L-glutamate ligase/coenzyme F420-1:gamma-L-glutamate ligase [Angulomicrobium tetraedrale]|uniref:Coenzyme F420-0:L-glutamate ligase/coenzyme F420-1:gamma-L-glutamate ligase n=1 Tax=Ancylobacter tetraedralis TaxID=217068 RepID=A0A839Z3M1_9HYPH|nr:coenzyme F420-0:L-glutamate ligase [Ancylobacter tetraedralis]MBB3770219.1 coenzyme F420-0:L-glutamate ligase/coenzyme F420-1:gamma-L-glutamate ligase [Ancylobacter tetraedralis]
MSVPPRLELLALDGLPLVQPGDDLAGLIAAALDRAGLVLRDGDVLVVAQKIVSKAEGRRVALADVTPTARAGALAQEVGKDARLVELILRESRRVVRQSPGVLIVEHRLGLVMANAGIDQSNVEDGFALLLPEDPDASAERLRARLVPDAAMRIGIVINDSFGRPWRRGTVGTAIGAAGLPALVDRRGEADLFGRPLQVTMIALADEIAAGASLLMGPAAEGLPVVLLRGVPWYAPFSPARALLRPENEDLFR